MSDGAKLTYLVLLSCDFLDAETGAHKGIVYPSIETLMAIRGKGKSTIYAHLAELGEFLVEFDPTEAVGAGL